MNFGFTKGKMIVSLLVGLCSGAYSSISQTIGIPSDLIFEFGPESIRGFLIGLVVVYVIWSFIQKK